MDGKRRAFTLIELLIVIVVIGILSAMMMFSSTEAVSSAKASNIISNMRNMKTAVTAWYLDNMDRVRLVDNEYKVFTDKKPKGGTVSEFVQSYKSEILRYLNNEKTITLRYRTETPNNTGDYSLISVNKSRQWYICYNLGTPPSRLKEKLAGRQKTTGLLGTDKVDDKEFANGAAMSTPYTNQKFACMLILDLGNQ